MTTALLTALALSIGLGYFGWLIQKQIWSGTASPTSPVEYGRKFAGYVVVAASISGANFFIKDELSEALIKFIIILIAFPSVGFAVGCLFGLIKKPAAAPFFPGNESAQEQSVPPVKFESFKINPLIVATGVIAAAVLVILYQVVNTKSGTEKSELSQKYNWVPYSNLVAVSHNLEIKGKFHYLDEASIVKSGAYTYGVIGSDTEKQGWDGRNFIKQKVEADCSVPKYRRIETYAFSGNLENGLGALVFEDKNHQRTIARDFLMNDKNYVHNGGWVTKANAERDLEIYSNLRKNSSSEYMINATKGDLAILSWLCN